MVDGDLIRLAAISGVTEKGVEAVRSVYYPMRLSDETVAARTIRSGAICHVPDVLSDPLYPSKEAARIAEFRACLGVPMIRDGQVVGAIFVARKQPELFADAQVQLLKTFAAQAVIAIENTRLLKELRQRTDDLTELLEQQTATSEVLKVISSSPGELEPVFHAMLENATRICEANFGNFFMCDGRVLAAVAIYGNEKLRRLLATQSCHRPTRASGRAARPHPRKQADRPHCRLAVRSILRRERRPHSQSCRSRGRANLFDGALAQGGRSHRRHRLVSPRGAPVHRQADRIGEKLRRAGRNRHREHAAAQGAAPAHRRSHRVAGAADRDVRSAAGYFELAGRTRSGCSSRCWRTPPASARPRSGILWASKTAPTAPSRCLASRRNTRITSTGSDPTQSTVGLACRQHQADHSYRRYAGRAGLRRARSPCRDR